MVGSRESRLRDDQNYWTQVEAYVSRHADVQFSHGICPDCYERIVAEEMREAESRRAAPGPGDPPLDNVRLND